MLSKNTTRNIVAVTHKTLCTTFRGLADAETAYQLMRKMETLAKHRPQRLCDPTPNCSSVEKRDCSQPRTQANHGFQMTCLAFLPKAPLSPRSSLGQSVSNLISQISRVASDPVPTYFRKEMTPSMKFTRKSNHFQVAHPLPALLHHMRSIHGVKTDHEIAETGQSQKRERV